MSLVYTHIKKRLLNLTGISFRGDDFLTLFRESLMPTTLVDKRGRILHANKAYLKMIGKTHEEIIKTKLTDFVFIKDRERLIDFIKTVENKDNSEKFFGCQSFNYQGKTIEILIKKTSLSDRNKTLLFHFDLSDQVKNIKASLSQEAENRKNNNQFRQISHNVLTPLYEIIGSLELIDRGNLTTKDSSNINSALNAGVSLKNLLHKIIEQMNRQPLNAGLNLHNSENIRMNELKKNIPQETINTEKAEWKPRVLIVDDNEICSRVTASMLERSGSKTTRAEDGFKAIELAVKEKFDIIFMDINMPGIDGYETTQRIKEKSLNENTPVIALTAYYTTEDRKKAELTGMSEFIPKPPSEKILKDTVSKYTSKPELIHAETISEEDSIPVSAGPEPF